MLLKDKVAIITGGGSGLGEAACKLFAKEGAKVVVADFDLTKARVVADFIHEHGGQAIADYVDVSQRATVYSMVDNVIDIFGRVDILVNNAGITMDSTLVKMKQEQWDNVIAVNQTGVFNCTQEVIPRMIQQGFGRIINTSSIVGRFGNFGQTNYAATKAAVIAMTQTWAKELGRKGINVNAVAPGFIATPMTKKMPPDVLKKMESMVSIQRLGDPEDVANVYLFLASEASKYINGAVIPVDGGLSI